MDTVKIGGVEVSRFIIGSNPFSGFSHQGVEMDQRMVHYYTHGRIIETLRDAEKLGINTLIARADHHVIRLLTEYWDADGTLQWLAQTCPELGSSGQSVGNAIARGAKGCHIHGGVTDHLLAEGRLFEVQSEIDRLREAGLVGGIAGHNPAVFEFAEEHLDVDYYMCCHYNPSNRDKNPEHVHGAEEKFREEDRQRMLGVIAGLSKPVIHYKVLAAGRNDPAGAFAVTARAMRDGDAVCVGIYTEDRPDMLRQDIELLEENLSGVRAAK